MSLRVVVLILSGCLDMTISILLSALYRVLHSVHDRVKFRFAQIRGVILDFFYWSRRIRPAVPCTETIPNVLLLQLLLCFDLVLHLWTEHTVLIVSWILILPLYLRAMHNFSLSLIIALLQSLKNITKI